MLKCGSKFPRMDHCKIDGDPVVNKGERLVNEVGANADREHDTMMSKGAQMVNDGELMVISGDQW